MLILENLSSKIDKTEVGGGEIYLDGKEYVYCYQVD